VILRGQIVGRDGRCIVPAQDSGQWKILILTVLKFPATMTNISGLSLSFTECDIPKIALFLDIENVTLCSVLSLLLISFINNGFISNFMEHNYSSEANRHSATEEISRHFMEPCSKQPATGSYPEPDTSIHNFPFFFTKIHSIIFPPTPIWSRYSAGLRAG
jgi:hypothetical protein